jgi:hypothetical protein
VKADSLSVEHDAHLAEAALHHGKYPAAPVSNLYLFGRSEDFAVEHERESVSSRDHARFWDTKRQDQNTHLEIWIGDCSRDIGIKIVHKNHHVGTTHRIDGNLDAERALIVSEIQQTGRVSTVVMEPGMGPTKDAVNGEATECLPTEGRADRIEEVAARSSTASSRCLLATIERNAQLSKGVLLWQWPRLRRPMRMC